MELEVIQPHGFNMKCSVLIQNSDLLYTGGGNGKDKSL